MINLNLINIREQICGQQVAMNANAFNSSQTHSFFSQGKRSVIIGNSTATKAVPIISNHTRVFATQ